MRDAPTFGSWCLSEADLEQMTATKARDLIVKCFFEAQRETFARVQKKLGQIPSDQEVLETVKGAVRLAFRQSGGDFDAPTRDSLTACLEVLMRKAAAWGTPPDIVAHHGNQIQRVLHQLDASSAKIAQQHT